MKSYRVRNWDKYQYSREGIKFRNLPWIKIHRDLLTSKEWIKSNGCTKIVLLVILLIADNFGRFDSELECISTLVGPNYGPIRVQVAINFLLEMGFIEVIASNADIVCGELNEHTYSLSGKKISGVDSKGEISSEREELQLKVIENKRKKIYTD